MGYDSSSMTVCELRVRAGTGGAVLGALWIAGGSIKHDLPLPLSLAAPPQAHMQMLTLGSHSIINKRILIIHLVIFPTSLP